MMFFDLPNFFGVKATLFARAQLFVPRDVGTGACSRLNCAWPCGLDLAAVLEVSDESEDRTEAPFLEGDSPVPAVPVASGCVTLSGDCDAAVPSSPTRVTQSLPAWVPAYVSPGAPRPHEVMSFSVLGRRGSRTSQLLAEVMPQVGPTAKSCDHPGDPGQYLPMVFVTFFVLMLLDQLSRKRFNALSWLQGCVRAHTCVYTANYVDEDVNAEGARRQRGAVQRGRLLFYVLDSESFLSLAVSCVPVSACTLGRSEGSASEWRCRVGQVTGRPALQNLQGKEQLRADGSDRHVVSVTTHLYRVTAVSPRDQSLGPQPAVARGGLLRECHAIGEVTPFVSRQHSIGLLWCSVFGEPMMLLSFPEF
ncbi:hypothetical protein CB1_000394026 [Camelus ferus]|nr:hypothetical protein CB1_000394026 [Camelus ferus]